MSNIGDASSVGRVVFVGGLGGRVDLVVVVFVVEFEEEEGAVETVRY